jgi:hypothetical protein
MMAVPRLACAVALVLALERWRAGVKRVAPQRRRLLGVWRRRTSVRQFAELRSSVCLGCGAYGRGGGGIISNPLRLAEGSRCGAAGSLID